MPKKNIFIILFFIFLSLFLIFSIFIVSLFRPVSSDTLSQRFVIPKGQAISIIGQRLQAQGLIKSSLAFRLIVRQHALANKIQAGSFDLSPNMSLGKIAIALTKGTEDLWVTIPEGYRVEEIAESLDSYEELTLFNKAEFLDLAKYSEGYLFPDTYLVPRQMDAEGLFNLFTDTFDKKVNLGLEKELENSDKSLEDILVMASIVEREAGGDKDQPQVAGILWNRIDIGMALQVDATLQYSKGYNKIQDSWWVPPLAVDKKINSPFNTYMNLGLPPRPICNPGLSAMRAALDPTESDYLYYIHDRKGRIHFAETIDGHNANVNKYLR
ncbi:MAG: endolytic transglycosylase MltG [Patescibacteria group bacterium]